MKEKNPTYISFTAQIKAVKHTDLVSNSQGYFHYT